MILLLILFACIRDLSDSAIVRSSCEKSVFLKGDAFRSCEYMSDLLGGPNVVMWSRGGRPEKSQLGFLRVIHLSKTVSERFRCDIRRPDRTEATIGVPSLSPHETEPRTAHKNLVDFF
jgi:hypothetical protein